MGKPAQRQLFPNYSGAPRAAFVQGRSFRVGRRSFRSRWMDGSRRGWCRHAESRWESSCWGCQAEAARKAGALLLRPHPARALRCFAVSPSQDAGRHLLRAGGPALTGTWAEPRCLFFTPELKTCQMFVYLFLFFN